jgi:large subunit ribosomal protein L4
MEVKVLNKAGQDTGRTVNLPEEIFGITPNQQALYLDVKQYLANQRQGTHKSKERAEISRTTKKLKKQKGTGGARAGSMKSPLFVGGGRVFGPRPRDYHFKLNRKLKELARRSALSAKTAAGVVIVVEDFTIETPSTKQYISFLAGLQVSAKKTLHILPESNQGVVLSSRNLAKAKVTTVNHLSTYELINADRLVISEQSVAKIIAHFQQA